MDNLNPLLQKENSHRLQVIPFDLIKTEHFMPAIHAALANAKAALESYRQDTALPTFENTILALGYIDEELDFVSGVYYNLYGAEADAELKALAQEISPLLAEFSSYIMTDSSIFARVKAVYQAECVDKPQPAVDFDNPEQMAACERYRLTEHVYQSFQRNGAMLDADAKKRLTEIDMEQSKLSPKFSDNVLNATNAYELLLTDPAEVEGIPASALQAAAYRAKQKGHAEGWLFNLQMPNLIPVLSYCKNRDVREKMFKAHASKAFGDKFDNQDNIKRILELRAERAKLLGYASHAHYVLEDRMAETPDNALALLDKIYKIAFPAAQKEAEEIKALALEMDGLSDVMSWDYSYYSNKLKEKKYAYDPEELRPWFKLESVLEGLFKVAELIYGIKLTQVCDIPVYHPDVTTWEVHDADGSFIGLLYLDMFPRENKRGGAWMNTIQGQGLHQNGMKKPYVINVASLTPSTPEQPSLLRFDEVRTVFHEFGHGLHGLLSDCHYKALAGPNVLWDFVELPSQIMENWLLEKEALNIFAKHYETGESLPDELIDKVLASMTFQAGNANLTQYKYAFLDMSYHLCNPADITDVDRFEKQTLAHTVLLPVVPGSSISCSFSHIFAGGYGAGYYSYKWAEALEADAWSLIKEKGIFNQEITLPFRKLILSRGNSVHPMDLFVAFRGRKPDPDAMLKRDGLI